MRIEKSTQRFRHGDYLAEVDVDLRVYEGREWSPTMTLQDTRRLERVREALVAGRLKDVAKDARLFRIQAVNASDPGMNAA